MKSLALARDKAEVLGRLRAVRPDSTRRWGRMTAHQMVCHLSDAFRVALGLKDASAVAVPIPRVIVRWMALYLPLPWPAGIPTWPEIDPRRGGTSPSSFAADVGALEELIERFTESAGSLHGRWHFTLGPMSQAEWLRWGYLHMDHHMRQFGA